MTYLAWVEIIIGVGLLIAVHEFGHFIMAKWNKVRVEVFSVGFGPTIFKFRRKNDETEYRLSWIPLGGYVKLSGELPTGDRIPEPHELWSKKPWQKFVIFFGGVFMNMLIAFPLCIAANWLGRYQSEPYVGTVAIPEAESGMLPGDKILSVEGKPIRSLDEYRIEVLRRSNGSECHVKILRDGKEIELGIPVMGSDFHRLQGEANKIASVTSGKLGETAGFKKGDELVQIEWDDQKLPVVSARTFFEEGRKKLAGKRVKATVRREDSFQVLEFKVPAKELYEYPVEQALMEPVLGRANKGHAAYEKLQPDDRVKSIDGVPVRSWADIREQLRAKGGKGKEVEVVVQRGGSEVKVRLKPGLNEKNEGLLGVGNNETGVIAQVPPDSCYAKAGLQPEDVLTRVGEISGHPMVSVLFGPDKDHSPLTEKDEVQLQVERKGKSVPLTLKPEKKTIGDLKELGLEFEDNRFFRTWGFGDGLADGLREPGNLFVLTFELLGKLVSGQESAKNLSGPLGIFDASARTIEQSQGNFLWLLALIAVNLAVINLLPLPILDGGHMWILLLAEKIRGRPPSERFFMIFQYVGLAFLLLMVIFVTFQDVGRVFLNKGF